MRFTVDPASSIPIYTQIVEQVKHAVASGRLRPGDALPSLRELAERLRISPLTVKKAYQELEAQGVTATEHGRGTFVRTGAGHFSEHYRQQKLGELVDHLLVEAHQLGASVDDVVEMVRARGRTLETEVIGSE